MGHRLIVLSSQPASLAEALAGLKPLVDADGVRERLVGVWRSEIGLLNQIVILLTAADETAPEPLLSAITSDLALLPYTVGVESVAIEAFQPYSPLETGDFFEFRDYRFKPGMADRFVALLKENIHLRVQYSPILGWFRPSEGDRDRIVSFWPFSSLDARTSSRALSREDKAWLAYIDLVMPLLREQRNWIMVPAY